MYYQYINIKLQDGNNKRKWLNISDYYEFIPVTSQINSAQESWRPYLLSLITVITTASISR
jgi:hypothetical protein